MSADLNSCVNIEMTALTLSRTLDRIGATGSRSESSLDRVNISLRKGVSGVLTSSWVLGEIARNIIRVHLLHYSSLVRHTVHDRICGIKT